MLNRLTVLVRLLVSAISARLPVSGVRGGTSLTRLRFMGVSSHTVPMIHGGDSNSTVDEFRLRSLYLFPRFFFFITYRLPVPSFKNTPIWRRFIATFLRGLSTYVVTGHIHLLFCHCRLIHIYSLLYSPHTSIACNLPFFAFELIPL